MVYNSCMIDMIPNADGYFPPCVPQKNRTVIAQQIVAVSNPYKLQMLVKSTTLSRVLLAKQASVGFETETLEENAEILRSCM